MRKLQVKVGTGWRWVFGRRMPEKRLMTCDIKAKALPPDAVWAERDLEWARKEWPEQEFRLGETLHDAV